MLGNAVPQRSLAAVFALAVAATALLTFHTRDHHDALRALSPVAGPALHAPAVPAGDPQPGECSLCLAAGHARSGPAREVAAQLMPAPLLAGDPTVAPGLRASRDDGCGPAIPRAPPTA
jgi:hypothetical protein